MMTGTRLIAWCAPAGALLSLLLLAGTGHVAAQTKPPAKSTPAPIPDLARPPAVKPPAPDVSIRAGSEVVARLGDIDVTADDVRAEIAQLAPREQAALARDPALLSKTVRLLLANRLVLKEALSKKWDQQPAVAAQLERIRQAALIESFLQSISSVPDGFPTEAQIQNVYEANMSAMTVPRQFQVAQIFIAAGGDKEAEDKARRKLDQVQKRLKQPDADFAAIAAADSDDATSAGHGGDLGWLSDSQLRPEIRAQVIGLSNAGVSDPIRLDDGWHIVKLVDTKAAYTRPLAEVRDQLAGRIRDERATALRRAYLTKLMEQSPPAINELALSRLLEKPGK
jgi:parvulin-like peptidyl-prolyl isomerase